MSGLIKKTVGALSILSICFSGNPFAIGAMKSELIIAFESSRIDSTEEFTEIEQRVVTVQNLRVNYIEGGTGRAVVLIHGNAGGIEDFEFGAMDLLAREYRVIAIDRPGHGNSDRPGEAGSVERQAEFLHKTLLNLGVKQPILVGHSWGGSLALAYALKYPGEVSSMVLLAPAAYPDRGGNIFLRAAAKVPLVGEIGVLLGQSIMGRQMLKREIQNAFYPQSVPDSYFKLITASWLGRKQLKSFFEDEVDLNDSLAAMHGHYSEIKIPVVIVTGDKDKVVSPKENAYRLQKAIPRSRLIELKNTGHEIPQTNPKSIGTAIRLVRG